LDDSFWKKILPFSMQIKRPMVEPKTKIHWQTPRYLYAALVVYLSVPVITNLMSKEQSMNRSFDNLRIVNTYGAFGSVGNIRTEVVFEGQHHDGTWVEYQFKCKPGDVDRMPCWISPYHYRLDWLIWFAGIEASYGQGPRRHTWTIHLLWKLLNNDETVLQLLDENPFATEPPKKIRVSIYEYRFSPLTANGWWEREKTGLYIPALNKENPNLRTFLQNKGWL
jgi:hypothetical protein